MSSSGQGSGLSRIHVSDGGELLSLEFILHENTVKATLNTPCELLGGLSGEEAGGVVPRGAENLLEKYYSANSCAHESIPTNGVGVFWFVIMTVETVALVCGAECPKRCNFCYCLSER